MSLDLQLTGLLFDEAEVLLRYTPYDLATDSPLFYRA